MFGRDPSGTDSPKGDKSSDRFVDKSPRGRNAPSAVRSPPPTGKSLPWSVRGAAPSSGSTVTAIRTCWSKAAPRASSRRVRSRPSIWLRVKSSPTAMIAVFSCNVIGRLAANQARWFGGRSSTRLRHTVSKRLGWGGSGTGAVELSFTVIGGSPHSNRVSGCQPAHLERARTRNYPELCGLGAHRDTVGPHVCPQVVHAAQRGCQALRGPIGGF